MKITAHGIEFVRTGACRQCGACGCAKGPCPHWWQRGGRHFCAIYSTREAFCEVCGTDHASCVGFPDNPWIGVVRDGVCGYTFERADGGRMDELPFLFGEPWLRR